MKSIVRTFLFLSIILITSNVKAWEFNEDGNVEGWRPARATVEARDGSMIVSINADTLDPFVNSPFGPYDANQITGVLMKMRWSVDPTSYGGTRIYFFPSSGGHNSIGYTPPSDPNEFSVVLVDFLATEGWENDNKWESQINNIRLDLADNVTEDYTVEVDWIRLESLYLDNETFEWMNMKGWEVREGSLEDFNDLEQENVYNGSYALKITGTDGWHALKQPIKGGLGFVQGDRVAVMGAAKIPVGSWDDNSRLWVRVTEKSMSGVEDHTPLVEVTVFDEWFEFRAEKQLIYEPPEREWLEVHLYSSNPAGKPIYLDDIFVEVLPAPKEGTDEYDHWRWTKSNWEFNTPGDAEGWSPKNDQDIAYFGVDTVDVNDNPVGALLLDLPGGTFDPFINGPVGPYYTTNADGVAVRMRFNGTKSDMVKPGDGGQHTVYWFYTASGHDNSPQFEIPAANEWFIAYIDCSSIWSSWINNIRFDLGHYPNLMLVDIDWIRMYGNYIKNNSFEEALEPWTQVGDGFSLSSDQVQTGQTALKIEGRGIGVWHAAEQRVIGWDTDIPKGAKVTVRGSYHVPASSWVEGSLLWLRVNELQGGTVNENLSPTPEEMEVFVPVLDAWTPFEQTITTNWEPDKRGHLSVQLFSQMPEGALIYVDDVFVDVEAQGPVSAWPVNSVKLAEGQVITIDTNVSAEEYAGVQALVFNAETLTAEDPYFDNVIHTAQLLEQSTETSLEDFNATYYFMWDDTYFYAAVSVQDDNCNFVGPYPNGSDALQFVFGQTAEEDAATNMYIPTISPDDGTGSPMAKNDFDGWITRDIMAQAEYASSVDPATQDWTVEVKIPWSAMQGDFETDVFPPNVGDSVGFSLLGIDYDNGALGWFAAIDVFPWTGNGLQSMYFIERPTE
jgi:hypothetical protein